MRSWIVKKNAYDVKKGGDMNTVRISYGIFKTFIFLLVLFSAGTSLAEEKAELVFYNWTAYVGKGVIEKFEETRNVKVNQKFYQSSDERDEKIMRGKGKGYDVIMVNGNDIVPYRKRGWIVPLGVDKIPNLSQMDERWVNFWPETAQYAVPYLWGTFGIIYRSDLIKEDITSWKQFYNPKDEWRGKIMLVDIHRLVIGLALKSLGYSINSEDPDQVREAVQLVRKQKPFVQTYGYLKTDAESGIVSGKTWIGQTWNGDALLLQKRNPHIRYVLPEEGGEIWMDYMVVSAHSKNKELAYDFVNYLSEASNSAKAAFELEFATPNKEARKLLPQDMLENKTIYPSEKQLSTSEPVKNVNPRIKRQMIEAWTQLNN